MPWPLPWVRSVLSTCGDGNVRRVGDDHIGLAHVLLRWCKIISSPNAFR